MAEEATRLSVILLPNSFQWGQIFESLSPLPVTAPCCPSSAFYLPTPRASLLQELTEVGSM